MTIVPTWPGWEHQIESLLGAPQGGENDRFLDEWQAHESGPPGPPLQDYNPLNMDYGPPGGEWATGSWASSGYGATNIAVFPNPNAGAHGTSERIAGGRYPNIVAGLKSGHPFEQPGIGGDLSTWGTGQWWTGSGGGGGSGTPPGGGGGSTSPSAPACSPAMTPSQCQQAGGTWVPASGSGGGLQGGLCDCSAVGGQGAAGNLNLGGELGSILGGLFGGSLDLGGIFKEAFLRLGELVIGVGLVYIGIRGLVSA